MIMGSKIFRAKKRGESVKSQEQIAQGCRQRRILLKGIFGLMVGLLGLSTDPAYALRCGNRLVLVGASTVEVLEKCGEPAGRDQWVEYRIVSQPPPFSFVHPQEQEQVYLPVTIEEWVYNFGPKRFMQKFHFEDGRLSDIESLGYGN